MDIAADTSVVEPRRVCILGSTGSVGKNTIDLIERQPGAFVVEALTANTNVALLAEQARRLRPKFVVVADPSRYQDLKDALNGCEIEVGAGPQAVVEAASRDSDWVMAAIVGAAGLKPTMAAVKRGAVIGLANKECLVSAGEIMTDEVERHNAVLLPVDSEHNAIYQVFDFEHPDKVERIILTASGGPFRDYTREAMANVTPAQAVAHPNWDMGAKISVDSATMMNKGLELIEAYHLFPITKDRIEIVVHPQSVIHSMVAYVDGSVLAQMGTPDMRTPIAYTLSWPQRMHAPAPRLELEKIGTLTFESPDPDRFPALRMAREVLEIGGAAPTILNAANEVAVEKFLAGTIGYLDITQVVEHALKIAPNGALTSLDDVFAVDSAAREIAYACVDKRHFAA